ncbi:MAG: CarD family transcriptional regulator, partial [Candidatus Puniceispirillales bacterium]
AEANAYHRTNTVREPGEYAMRGGIIDVFPPGGSIAVRLDLFGDEIESIKTFDPETQRSGDMISHVRLYPVSEIPMDEASITLFRRHYIDSFGGIASRDVLYQVVSTGRRVTGIEHYLPLFHDDLTHLSAYCDNMLVVQADETAVMRQNRFEQIQDFYTARSEYAQAETNSDEVFRPLPPDALYLTDHTHTAMMSGQAVMQFMSFISDINKDSEYIVINSKNSPLLYQNQSAHDDHDLAELRQLVEHRGASQTAILAASSRGGLERLSSRLEQYMSSTDDVHIISSWKDMVPAAVNLMVWPLEHGFIMPELFVLTEQDIFGRRLHRPQGRRRRAEHFLREVSSLNEGDLVVHVDHGIGRYESLETLNILGADHDCVLLVYAGGDKLYLPVENIDLLSRYGREGGEVALDKLGGVAW